MREFTVITASHKRLSLFLSLSLGLTLAFILLPGIHSLNLEIQKVLPLAPHTNLRLLEMSLFTFIAAILFLSLPPQARASEPSQTTLKFLLPSYAIPTLIAFSFGWVMRKYFSAFSQSWFQDLFWFVICIPIGEELLFRGWAWSVFRTLGKKSFFSLTNPLPSELVFSSLTFSLWHFQNYEQLSQGLLIFQLLYTFFTGLWLGFLRWKSGRIHASILAHAMINLAAILPTFL